MKPGPTHSPSSRIRKMIKWGKYGGMAATMLLVVVWIGSGWYEVSYSRSDWSCMVEAGQFEWEQGILSSHMTRWGRMREYGTGHPFPFVMKWSAHVSGGFFAPSYLRFITVPLWIPVVLCASASGGAWRLDTIVRRRERVNHCSKCNYDRAGIAANAKCPECGSPPA